MDVLRQHSDYYWPKAFTHLSELPFVFMWLTDRIAATALVALLVLLLACGLSYSCKLVVEQLLEVTAGRPDGIGALRFTWLLFESVFEFCAGLLHRTFQGTVVAWTRIVYMHGPTLLGGWGGKSMEEICAHMTNVHPDHWSRTPSNLDDCRLFVDKQVNAATVALLCVCGVYLLYRLINEVFVRYSLWNRQPPHFTGKFYRIADKDIVFVPPASCCAN